MKEIINKKPLLTIITAAYIKYDDFENTLKSVFEQDYPRIEYIIADDGSPNFDREKIESLVRKYKGENIENICIIHNENNIGTVKNLNVALKQSHGDYFMLLDADDMFYDSHSVHLIMNRMINEECDLLSYSRIACTKDNVYIRKMPEPYFYRKIEKLNTIEEQYKALVTCRFYEMASGSAMCISKKLMLINKNFDETYKYWEDGPFYLNSFLNGFKINTAYDIVGIYYRMEGISNTKGNSPLQKGLKFDAQTFYKNAIKRKIYLSKYDERRVKYHMLKLAKENIVKKVILIFRYFDVFVENKIIQAKYFIARKFKLKNI